jgi:lipopolysaccharide transport system permease protein
VALVDFAINLAILFWLDGAVWCLAGLASRIAPSLVASAMLASLGPAFLITALNVKYREFRYILLFIVQFGLNVLPVGFSNALVPEQCRWYSLNPMVGVIDGFSGAYWEAKPGSSIPVCL